MASNLWKFNKIYNETYYDVLKYIIIKCHNINDANDILQEVYLEFWKILNKKDIVEDNIKSFLIGIAINKIKKHYSLIDKVKVLSLHAKNLKNMELFLTTQDGFNVEEIIVKNDDWNSVWEYIKKRKNKDIAKIFYLYYRLDLSIKEIAILLNVSESYVKNLIYRTLSELQKKFGNGGVHND